MKICGLNVATEQAQDWTLRAQLVAGIKQLSKYAGFISVQQN